MDPCRLFSLTEHNAFSLFLANNGFNLNLTLLCPFYVPKRAFHFIFTAALAKLCFCQQMNFGVVFTVLFCSPHMKHEAYDMLPVWRQQTGLSASGVSCQSILILFLLAKDTCINEGWVIKERGRITRDNTMSQELELGRSYRKRSSLLKSGLRNTVTLTMCHLRTAMHFLLISCILELQST